MNISDINTRVTNLGEAWENFKQVNAKRLAEIEANNHPVESGHVYFIAAKEMLTQEQYDRLKKQIDDAWPKNLPRPILLEGCEVIKL